MAYKIKNIKNGITYVNALYEKMNTINFIRGQLEIHPSNKFSDILKLKNLTSINLSSPEIDSVFITEQIFIEHAITISNSFSDILLQLINMELLVRKYKEKDVTFTKIRKDIESNQRYLNLSHMLKELMESEERKYINAFTNKVKHENIIKKKSHLSSNEINGPVICSFIKDDIPYDELDWKQVFSKIDIIFKKAISIGIEIDETVLPKT